MPAFLPPLNSSLNSHPFPTRLYHSPSMYILSRWVANLKIPVISVREIRRLYTYKPFFVYSEYPRLKTSPCMPIDWRILCAAPVCSHTRSTYMEYMELLGMIAVCTG